MRGPVSKVQAGGFEALGQDWEHLTQTGADFGVEKGLLDAMTSELHGSVGGRSPLCSKIPRGLSYELMFLKSKIHKNICLILSAKILLILSPALSLIFNKTTKSDLQSVLL